MPIVSDHGKTYEFTIETRPEVQLGRSSDGRQLQGGVRSRRGSGNGVERDRRTCPTSSASTPRCTRRQRASSGVIANGMKLTIRLTRADPTLLEKLAMPYFCAIPTDPGSRPPRSRHASERRPVLRQQPHDRPTGRPAEEPVLWRVTPAKDRTIVITTNTDQATVYLQVRKGEYAIDFGGPPSAVRAKLAKEFGVNKGRFFVNSSLVTGFLALNTARPAMGDVNMRKAINYAIDRPGLLHVYGQVHRHAYVAAAYLRPSRVGEYETPYPATGLRTSQRQSRCCPGGSGEALLLDDAGHD